MILLLTEFTSSDAAVMRTVLLYLIPVCKVNSHKYLLSDISAQDQKSLKLQNNMIHWIVKIPVVDLCIFLYTFLTSTTCGNRVYDQFGEKE